MFLGYTFLLNLNTVPSYILASDVTDTTYHLLPFEDSPYPLPLLGFCLPDKKLDLF